MRTFRPIILFLFLIHFCSSAEIKAISSTSPSVSNNLTLAKKDTAELNNLTRKVTIYLSNPETIQEAKAYIDSAFLICRVNNIEVPALLYLLLAEYHFSSGDFRSASENALISLKQSAESGESLTLAKTYFFLGRYYQLTGFLKESIEYYKSAITIAEKKDIKGMIPKSYEGQANLFRSIGDMGGYRKNLQMMLDAGIAENDTAYVQLGYYRLGHSFCGDSAISKVRNYKMADSLLRISQRISLIRKDTSFTASSLATRGWNFYLEEMYDSAIIFYNNSLKYSLPVKKLLSTSANSSGNLGTIYRDLGEYGKSIKYYQKGIDLAKKVGDIFDLYWIYQDMSQMYLRLKDTANAYINYVLFNKYHEAFLKKESGKTLFDATVRYEADSNKKEVELLSLRLKNQRIVNFGFAGFMVLAMTIGLLLLRGWKLKNKRRISEMNRKISEITQANLRQQMNPHFIFNTLNSIQYYMYQHDKLATNNYLTKFSNLMRKVLDNSQHTSVPLSDEVSALNLYLELECIRFKDKFDFEINVDEEIDPLMYKVPTMLIQPYVENSISHGLMPKEGKGFVRIDIKLNQDHLLCTIEDNGIGRDASRERNLKRGNNHNSLGTQIATTRLDLVNALYGTTLKTVYSDLKKENGEPAGTRVEIHIPIIS